MSTLQAARLLSVHKTVSESVMRRLCFSKAGLWWPGEGMRQVSCLSRTTELVMCCKNYGFAVNTWPFMISETERDISWRLLGERWFLFFEREVLKLLLMVSFTFQPRWSSQDLYLPAGITGEKKERNRVKTYKTMIFRHWASSCAGE